MESKKLLQIQYYSFYSILKTTLQFGMLLLSQLIPAFLYNTFVVELILLDNNCILSLLNIGSATHPFSSMIACSTPLAVPLFGIFLNLLNISASIFLIWPAEYLPNKSSPNDFPIYNSLPPPSTSLKP